VYIQVDRSLVLTKGKDVVGQLLLEIQVRKCTADGAGAKKFYTELTTPPIAWQGEIRDLVLKKKLVGSSRYIFYITGLKSLQTCGPTAP
jgi:dipeptidyl-peptidase-3